MTCLFERRKSPSLEPDLVVDHERHLGRIVMKHGGRTNVITFANNGILSIKMAMNHNPPGRHDRYLSQQSRSELKQIILDHLLGLCQILQNMFHQLNIKTAQNDIFPLIQLHIIPSPRPPIQMRLAALMVVQNAMQKIDAGLPRKTRLKLLVGPLNPCSKERWRMSVEDNRNGKRAKRSSKIRFHRAQASMALAAVLAGSGMSINGQDTLEVMDKTEAVRV
jgi:hypothetical protein